MVTMATIITIIPNTLEWCNIHRRRSRVWFWLVYTYSIERLEGGRAGVCCGRSDVHGSKPSVGRSYCEKGLSAAPAVNS